MTTAIEHLQQLVKLPGPPGFEDLVAEYVLTELEGCQADVSVDAMCNVTASIGRADDRPALMIMAHMDEVSLFVKYIESSGALRVTTNGFLDERAVLAAPVDVLTKEGVVNGAVGVKSRHLLSDTEASAPLRTSDLWVDIGAISADEAESRGVRIGDPITFAPNARWLGRRHFSSKAIDNRAGCAVLLQFAQEAGTQERDYELVLVWSTQEEIGARGARVATQRIQPTMAIAIDTMPANDVATPAAAATAVCGGGPVIRIQDVRGQMGTVYSPQVTGLLTSVADSLAIPHQSDVFPTWTDAAGIHLVGEGVPTGGVYIPRRSSHSPSEIVDVSDIEAASALVAGFCDSLDATAIASVRNRPTSRPWVGK